MKALLPVFLCTCLLSIPVSADDEPLKPAAWVPLPAVGSSPETGFQYGAYVMRIFPQTDTETPQNRLELLLQGTTNGQFQVYIWPNLYFDAGRFQVKGKVGGKYWPVGYFGQDNEAADTADKYSDTALEASVTVNRKLSTHLAAGVKLFAEHHALDDIDEDPSSALLIEDGRALDNGLYSGAGMNLIYDTRNNLDWPSQGQYLVGHVDQFSDLVGSDATFTRAGVRGAHYWSVGDDVLALATDLRTASESTPFFYLPRPSGGATLRGANGNQWIDRLGLGLQGEYRMTLTPRWAVVGFADSYQVAESLSEVALSRFHSSVGAGVRFGMTPDRFNIRFDLGWVDFESVGFTITVGEAF